MSDMEKLTGDEEHVLLVTPENAGAYRHDLRRRRRLVEQATVRHREGSEIGDLTTRVPRVSVNT